MSRVALLGPASSIHFRRWAEALAHSGHVLHVMSQHRCERELLPRSAEVSWLPHSGSAGYFRNVPAVRRLLSTWRPELLNVHYASGYGTTMSLSGFRPTLLSVWGADVYDFPRQSALRGYLLRRNLRRATALASTSHAMAEQVKRLTPDREEVAVTPFGVDVERFAPDRSLRDPSVLTIGIVKSLAPKYGVDLLLRAFAGLLEDPQVRALPRPCRLLIVGGGPQAADLQELASRLGIGAMTRFAGEVTHDEVPAWLNRFDLYVAPSRLDSESFGVSVIEAGACELPVVVANVGGLPEVVVDGETGLVVPRDDVPALQAAIKRLLLDPALRERLGRDGRVRVCREYEWSHCVRLMQACYRRTIERAAASP